MPPNLWQQLSHVDCMSLQCIIQGIYILFLYATNHLSYSTSYPTPHSHTSKLNKFLYYFSQMTVHLIFYNVLIINFLCDCDSLNFKIFTITMILLLRYFHDKFNTRKKILYLSHIAK
jgi:hypothetical protein